MDVGSAMHAFLADGQAVTLTALAALIAVEALLRWTGFAQPEAVTVEVDER